MTVRAESANHILVQGNALGTVNGKRFALNGQIKSGPRWQRVSSRAGSNRGAARTLARRAFGRMPTQHAGIVRSKSSTDATRKLRAPVCVALREDNNRERSFFVKPQLVDGVRPQSHRTLLRSERKNVHAFSLAYSNIRGRENWSRGWSGGSILAQPFTRR
jgi:hypothetical protein